jgi:hypothetical protein
MSGNGWGSRAESNRGWASRGEATGVEAVCAPEGLAAGAAAGVKYNPAATT